MTARNPDRRKVLLVVDAQVGVLAGTWNRQRVLDNLVHLVDRARAANATVIWVQHEEEDMPRGSDAWQWAPPLAPAHGEPCISKRCNSAFEDTALASVLDELGARHLVLAGALSNWCIRATAHAALERGLDLTLVSDAHTTGDIELEDGRVLEAAQIVEELNIAMTWMRYPGRRNATATTQAVDFGAA